VHPKRPKIAATTESSVSVLGIFVGCFGFILLAKSARERVSLLKAYSHVVAPRFRPEQLRAVAQGEKLVRSLLREGISSAGRRRSRRSSSCRRPALTSSGLLGALPGRLRAFLGGAAPEALGLGHVPAFRRVQPGGDSLGRHDPGAQVPEEGQRAPHEEEEAAVSWLIRKK